MTSAVAKFVGLTLTVACWIWARNGLRSETWTVVLILYAPLFQYPITLLGRRSLNAQPVTTRAEWTSIFVHYAMMIVLGASIFPAIRIAQQRSPGPLPIRSNWVRCLYG